MGNAVGVVVIPEGFAPDGKIRIVSLKGVDRTGNEVLTQTTMHWYTSTSTDTTLTNYTVLPIYENTNFSSITNLYAGYFPSDSFSGTACPFNLGKFYTQTSYLIPPPIINENSNTSYYMTISGNNVLSDFLMGHFQPNALSPFQTKSTIILCRKILSEQDIT
jgi:hypothetical protein